MTPYTQQQLMERRALALRYRRSRLRDRWYLVLAIAGGVLAGYEITRPITTPILFMIGVGCMVPWVSGHVWRWL